MNKPPILSICIPTWNRAHTLPDLLTSIWEQWNDGIEVIVCDNASTDNTVDVITEWQKRIPIIYYPSPTNIGFDKNINRCVEQAAGKYVWIVGSDDILVQGAIAQVLDTIFIEPGALIAGHSILINRSTRQPLAPLNPFGTWKDFSIFSMRFSGDTARYLKKAKTYSALMCFISCQIFPRRDWINAILPVTGTNYDHMHRWWLMLQNGTNLVVRQVPLVYCRIGNHNLTMKQMTDRIRMDLDAMLRLSHTYPPFYNGDAKAVRESLRLEYWWRRMWRLETRLGKYKPWSKTRDDLHYLMGTSTILQKIFLLIHRVLK